MLHKHLGPSRRGVGGFLSAGGRPSPQRSCIVSSHGVEGRACAASRRVAFVLVQRAYVSAPVSVRALRRVRAVLVVYWAVVDGSVAVGVALSGSVVNEKICAYVFRAVYIDLIQSLCCKSHCSLYDQDRLTDCYRFGFGDVFFCYYVFCLSPLTTLPLLMIVSLWWKTSGNAASYLRNAELQS